MSEAEWLACKNYYVLYEFIRGKADKRKLRLFACACCRGVWHLLPDDRSRRAVEVSEQYADNLATKEELSAAQGMAAHAVRAAEEKYQPALLAIYKGTSHLTVEEGAAAWARCHLAGKQRAATKAAKAVARSTDRFSIIAEEMGLAAGWAQTALTIGETVNNMRIHHDELLRCVIGNPFRPLQLATGCFRPDVSRIAHDIYDDRAYDRLPVLADLLESAGCQNDDVLAHCRGNSPHTRGCWVLDLLTGRSENGDGLSATPR